eukprot:scaffold518_cov388-Prasinococcus_capsulatus_cf.AAC.24
MESYMCTSLVSRSGYELTWRYLSSTSSRALSILPSPSRAARRSSTSLTSSREMERLRFERASHLRKASNKYGRPVPRASRPV